VCLADIVMSDTAVERPFIVSFANTVPETSISKPAPDRLIAGSPEHTARNFFSDPTGQFFAGTWESTPGKWRVRYTEAEFCHITRGSLVIEDDHGQSINFQTGDSFVVPAGFTGTWTVREPTTKLYVIFESASK
jgi:uncharacterized cupin superfamily protein